MFCIVPWSAAPVIKSPVADWVVSAEAGAVVGAVVVCGAGTEGADAASGAVGAAGGAGASAGAVDGAADVDEVVAGVLKFGLS